MSTLAVQDSEGSLHDNADVYREGRFTRLGRLVRYRRCDLVDWVDAGLRFSTSDVGIELIEKNGSSS